MSKTSVFGSIWRRWDPHVHSPESVLNNQFPGAAPQEKWDRYLAHIEELEGVSALGITDYFSIEGFLKVSDAKLNGRLANIDFIFPNIELRITPVTAQERAVNLHILANPEIAPELEGLLFRFLTFEYAANTYACSKVDLTRLGREVDGNEGLIAEAAYEIGVNQFKTSVGQIRKALRANKRLKENCLIVVPNRSADGNSGLQDNNMRATREEIYRLCHAVFSSNPNDRAYFLGNGVDSVERVIASCGGLKPCIHGSDAHTLERIGEPDEQRYTWIKADATFEGLKQISFEPEYRVEIGVERPNEAFHRLVKTDISFPGDSRIVSGDFEDSFCFAGTQTIYFSPSLTCVIGGRGSGKSTLLNLLQESLGGKNAFFRNNSVLSAGKALDPSRHVQTEFVGSPDSVEFITQNEVEQFAISHERLTNAIYTRLKRLDADGGLDRAEILLNEELGKADTLIRLIIDEEKLTERLTAADTEIATNENLIKSLEDDAYIALTAESQAVATEQAHRRAGRLRLQQLIAEVEAAIHAGQSTSLALTSDPFEARRQEFIAEVQSAIANARAGSDLSLPDGEESALQARSAELEARLEKYLADRRISPENVTDISRASGRLAELQQQRGLLAERLQANLSKQREIQINDAQRAEYEGHLLANVNPINERLRGMGAEVQRISLEYRFDVSAARDAIIENLAASLAPIAEGGRAPRTDHIANALSGVDILALPSKDVLIGSLTSAPTQKTSHVLLDYFHNDFNYRIFSVGVRRQLLDSIKFRRLSVLYDSKPLQNASFGQRCSAALILLLTIGNTPIVVDEPEAHLDSALIANLLVALIKRVKRDRQIIFATHNANFVVNGDAELVHILDMNSARHTNINPSTLENLEHRQRILALEGGERAFQQREGRYGMRALVE